MNSTIKEGGVYRRELPRFGMDSGLDAFWHIIAIHRAHDDDHGVVEP